MKTEEKQARKKENVCSVNVFIALCFLSPFRSSPERGATPAISFALKTINFNRLSHNFTVDVSDQSSNIRDCVCMFAVLSNSFAVCLFKKAPLISDALKTMHRTTFQQFHLWLQSQIWSTSQVRVSVMIARNGSHLYLLSKVAVWDSLDWRNCEQMRYKLHLLHTSIVVCACENRWKVKRSLEQANEREW